MDDMKAIEELERFAKAMAADDYDAEDEAPPRKKGKRRDEDEGSAEDADEDADEYGKSFQLDDGSQGVDVTEFIRGVAGRIASLEKSVEQLAASTGLLVKGLAATGRMTASVRETVETFAKSGRGRKSEVALPGAAPEPAAGAVDAGAILMKSLDLAGSGRITASDVSEIEMAVRNGRAPHPRFHNLLGITS